MEQHRLEIRAIDPHTLAIIATATVSLCLPLYVHLLEYGLLIPYYLNANGADLAEVVEAFKDRYLIQLFVKLGLAYSIPFLGLYMLQTRPALRRYGAILFALPSIICLTISLIGTSGASPLARVQAYVGIIVFIVCLLPAYPATYLCTWIGNGLIETLGRGFRLNVIEVDDSDSSD